MFQQFNIAMQNLYGHTLGLDDIPSKHIILDSVDPDDLCYEFEFTFGIQEIDANKFLGMMDRNKVRDIIEYLSQQSN